MLNDKFSYRTPSEQSSATSSSESKKSDVARDAAKKALQVKKDGLTTCLSGAQARELHRTLGSEKGSGSKKTIKRRLQKAKKLQTAALWIDEADAVQNDEAIQRLTERLESLGTERQHHNENDVKPSVDEDAALAKGESWGSIESKSDETKKESSSQSEEQTVKKPSKPSSFPVRGRGSSRGKPRA